MLRVGAGILLLCLGVACGSPTVQTDAGDPLHIVEVDGNGTVGMTLGAVPIKGVIVYFHGKGQHPDVIYKNPKHRALFAPLLRSGYAVVASEAGGDAFGNPLSLNDYRGLAVAATTKYHAPPKLFVAESMGALASLALLTEDYGWQIRGMVGITPLMGIPAEDRSIDAVKDAWRDGVPPTADPMEWDPKSLEHRAFLLYQADHDEVIPTGATARDFATRFGAVADVRIARCAGGHVAADCYDSAGVTSWVAGLGL
jgi:hypothetical protein